MWARARTADSGNRYVGTLIPASCTVSLPASTVASIVLSGRLAAAVAIASSIERSRSGSGGT